MVMNRMDGISRVPVQLQLDPEVWRRARAYAVMSGVNASTLVEDFLRQLVMGEEVAGAEDLDQPGGLGKDKTSRIRLTDHGVADR